MSEPVEETTRFANGRVKYTGFRLDGTMHGAWSWYRLDGSLLQPYLTAAQRTYDRTGTVLRETTFPV